METILKLISSYKKGDIDSDLLIKAVKSISGLTKKQVLVTRGGKTFYQTVYVKEGEEEKEVKTPIGKELTPEVKGMNVTKYSEKSLLITGDTYVNIDTLRNIKKEIGVGNWNSKLKGWVFPIKFLETVLGYIWSDLKDKGSEEKAEAVQNQKNSGLEKGDNINIGDLDGNVEENVSDSEGIKYNVNLKDGTKLEGVDEKVMQKDPSTNDKEISETINNTTPEGRVKSEKKIYGIKPIEDIHNYSLQEYLSMHGLTQEDIDQALKSLDKKEEGKDKKPSYTRTQSKEYTKPEQKEGLTKRQLISKLIYNHYQAVKKAIENGENIKPDVLLLYPDLKEDFIKKKKELSEEHKRKISEALKKDKAEEENVQIKKENKEAKKEGFNQPDKKNYKPKDYSPIVIKPPKNSTSTEVTIYPKDYTDIPSIDVVIPKSKDILKVPKPYFIPDIDEKNLKRSRYSISAVKIDDDKYLVALDKFEKGFGSYMFSTEAVNQNGKYAIMTLDTFVATKQYYILKAKEELKNEQAKEKKERKEYLLKYYKEKMNLPEKEAKERLSKTKFSTSRLKVISSNRMPYDQMHMIQAFNRDEEGRYIGTKKTWEIYNDMISNMKQKVSDLSLQQEYIDSAYTKGAETSYGDSKTKNNLLEDYGIKVKRQNGDEINDSEIKQIENAMNSISKVFGNNIEMNKAFGLKISHSGDVLMHARKAVGLFHPAYNAIGVSAVSGDIGFKMTFAHEYGHFVDYWLGKNTGNHYASDKEGSLANQIARVLRKNMNKTSSSDYYNRTCECFARSMEQYYAVEILKNDNIFQDETQVNKEVYENQLKPLIKKFLDENKDFLKSQDIDIFNNEDMYEENPFINKENE
jgi:hypothetical protein